MTKTKDIDQPSFDAGCEYAFDNLYVDFLECILQSGDIDIESMVITLRLAKAVFEVQPIDFRDHLLRHREQMKRGRTLQ